MPLCLCGGCELFIILGTSEETLKKPTLEENLLTSSRIFALAEVTTFWCFKVPLCLETSCLLFISRRSSAAAVCALRG